MRPGLFTRSHLKNLLPAWTLCSKSLPSAQLTLRKPSKLAVASKPTIHSLVRLSTAK